jgi:hypothetical protein
VRTEPATVAPFTTSVALALAKGSPAIFPEIE